MDNEQVHSAGFSGSFNNGSSANTPHIISTANSSTSLLGVSATFTGAWEDVTDYTTVAVAILGSLATDGTLYFDLSTDGGTTFTSVPALVGDVTFTVPRILNVVESHVRIRYVNGTTAMTGTWSLQTKYSNGQEMSLLSPLDGFINSENPATLVRPGTDFDLDVARQHILGQRSFFFFGFNNAVGTSWEDIHPAGGDINWLTTATKVEVVSTSAVDNGTTPGLGVQSVEIHGLSATGVDQEEIVLTNGTSAVESALTYIRVNKMHSETCGTYGGSHQGDITCRVTGGGATLSKMTGEEGPVDTSVQYGSGEAGNGYWTVPLGKVMYITKLEVISDIGTNKSIDVALYEREDILDTTTPFAPRRLLWQESGVDAGLEHDFKSHVKIKSLTDVWFRAKGSALSKIEVELDFYLVDADSNGA
jgi:hypothetical protein